MRVADVFAALRLDTSEFKKGLQNLNGEVNTAAKDWGRTMTRFGRSTQQLGRTMTTNLTLPIIGVGAATSKLAIDFDTTLRQIVGLAKVPQNEIEGIGDAILKMAGDVGRAPQELAEAFYFVASAGFEADEAMEVLETSAKAAAAGMGQTQDIAKVLGGVLNAYGHENISAAHAADVLTAAVQDGAAEAADFASVIGRVAPGAAALGVSFDQVTAALAAMTNVGISAEEGATSLVQIFNSLLKPTSQAEEAMEGLGLSAEGLRKQLREQGLLATLRTLEERFGNNETASAAVFGNIRALRGITALLALDTDQLNGIFDDTAGALGNLQQAYDDTAGPQREIDKAMAELQATAIDLGQDVLPTVVDIFKQVAGAAKDVSRWWNSLSDDTKKAIVQWGLWIAVAGPALVVIGKLASGLGLVFKAVAALTSAKGLPLMVKNLGKAGLVGAVLLATYALGEVGQAAHDFFYELIHGKKALEEFNALLAEGANEKQAGRLRDMGISVEEFGRAVEAAGGDAEAAFHAIEDAGGDLAIAIGNLHKEAGDLVDDELFGVLDRQAKRAFLGIEGGAAAMADDIPGLVDGAFDPIADDAEKARKAAVQSMEALLNNLRALFDNDETLREAFQSLLERMQDPYTEAERRTDIFSKNTIAVIRGALKAGDPKIVGDTIELVNNMLQQIETMEPGALAAGEAVPPAIRKGMDAQVDALLRWIEENVTGEAIDSLTLSEAEEVGLDGIWRYAQGLKLNRMLAATEATLTAQAALRPLQEGVTASGRYGDQTGVSYTAGVGSRQNLERARTVSNDLSIEVLQQLHRDASPAGRSVAWSWIDAIAGVLSSWQARTKIQNAMQLLRTQTLGGSLPKSGPFAHPESGGASVAEAWGGGLVDGLRSLTSGLSAELRLLGDRFAMTPAFAGLAAYPTPTLRTGGTGTDPYGTGGPSVINNYNLNVTGGLTIEDSEDAVDKMRILGSFGFGSAVT